MNWIRRLDQESVDSPNYYVYAVQNGNAVELARILNATFGTGGGSAGTTADVAPDNQSMDVSIANDTSGQEQPNARPAGLRRAAGKIRPADRQHRWLEPGDRAAGEQHRHSGSGSSGGDPAAA